MMPLLASLHRAHQERLKRLGDVKAPQMPKPVTIEPPPPAPPPEPPPPEPPPPEPEKFRLSLATPHRFHVLRRLVQREFSVTDLRSVPGRRVPVVRARNALIYLARKDLGLTLTNIGNRLGRDHTTVMHSVQRANAMLLTDADFAHKVESVRARFRAVTISEPTYCESP